MEVLTDLKSNKRIKMSIKVFNKATNALKWCTWINLGMLAFCLIGMLVDNRTLLGENVWLKPAKFGVSIAIYCTTIALLLTVYPYSFKVKQRLSRIISWVLILEIPLVMVQAGRGVRSHFNSTTALDGIIFGLMGLLIFVNTLVLFYMMYTAFFKKLLTNLTMQRAIQFGWLAMIVSIIAGQQMIAANAHAVGVPDGGAGVPITHWSTEGGDWRVVHFLGMHGIQIFPLLAYFLKEKRSSLSIIWILGLAFLIFIGYIFVKTQAGIPFFAV